LLFLIDVRHFCKIQDKDDDFYRGKIILKGRVDDCSTDKLYNLALKGFHIIVCGLDSIIARRWINGMLVMYITLSKRSKYCT
jgi:hypothetical protein